MCRDWTYIWGGVGWWCLTPLSPMFQLFRDGQIYYVWRCIAGGKWKKKIKTQINFIGVRVANICRFLCCVFAVVLFVLVLCLVPKCSVCLWIVLSVFSTVYVDVLHHVLFGWIHFSFQSVTRHWHGLLDICFTEIYSC